MPRAPDPDAPMRDWTAAIRADIESNSGLSMSSAKRAASGSSPLFAFAALQGISTWRDVSAEFLLEWSAEPIRDRGGRVVRERDADEIRAQMWKARHVVGAAARLGAPVPLLDGDMGDFLDPPQKPARADDDPAEIADAVAAWRPQRWRHGNLRDLDTVLPEVRERVLVAQPEDIHQARKWLRVLAGFALWAVADRHSDLASMHTPNNVETWVMRVNSGQDDDWQNRARGVLRRLGPTVNPAAWPRPARPIPARRIAAPYRVKDEQAFRAAALLPRRDRRARIWVVIAAAGAGLNGTEIAAAEPGDIVERPDGRWEIRVRGTRARRVPIRRGYLPLAADLAAAECDTRYVASDKSGAVHQIVQRIRVGDEGLSLTRARNTFLAAHLRAGTPPAALVVIAGGVSYATLDRLLPHVADRVDPDDAVERALGA